MIRSLLKFCLRERLVIFIACVAVIAYGWHSTRKVPIDAIPNVGENQVIVLTEWMGRSPKDIEDQITYPLSVALQAVPLLSALQTYVPVLWHSPVPTVHASPLLVKSSSVLPSQSLSLPSQTSVTGPTFPTQPSQLPAEQSLIPLLHSPTSVPQEAVTPSSFNVSQSSSTLLHVSVAPG